MGHKWTRKEAQRANRVREMVGYGGQTPLRKSRRADAVRRERWTPAKPEARERVKLPRIYTESRKNPETGRYEYLVGGTWMSRQAVFYYRQKKLKIMQESDAA
jgi:hypothetical protein